MFLKTGDAILCAAISGGPEGLRIKTDLEPDLLVPAVALRAVELLPSEARLIARNKLARMLTLPRMQQADPPTHMLRLPSGDYIRGKLLSLDERVVRMEVLGIVKELPRSEAARLIWLSLEGDDAEGGALQAVVGVADAEGMPMRATLTNGRWLTMWAVAAEAERVTGINGVFGRVSVDLARCDQLELGPAAGGLPEGNLPYGQWILKPAPGPVARPPTGASSSRSTTTETFFRRRQTCSPRSTSTASERCHKPGHDKAAGPPDSERLRADTRKTPLQRGKAGGQGKAWCGPGDRSTRLTSRLSVGRCLRKCHWPDYR